MKTILLTGASGGIGSAIASALNAAGVKVVGVDRQDADLSSYKDIAALADRVGKGSPLDWLVFAHGFIGTQTDLLLQTPEEIKTTFDTNIVSLVYLTKLFLPALKPGGGIVFISSTSGLNPNGRYSTYSASKAAVNAFSQALARHRTDLIFYSVCPGPTDTAMRTKVMGVHAAAQSPAAVANLIANLVSKKTSHKSGDIIIVRDGIVTKAGGVSNMTHTSIMI